MAATKPAFNPPGKKGDIIFSVLVKLAALIVLLMLGGIIVSLIISSWPSIQKFGLAFLWTKEWDAPNDIYGALVPIYGTLVTSFIALLIAVPVSFGIALFLTHLAKKQMKTSELRATYPPYFISKKKVELTPDINVDAILAKVKEKFAQYDITDIDGVKIDFPEKWVHLRKSNTEPIIRIYSEAHTMQEAEEIGDELIQIIRDMCK